ncbi:hypothetical protein [Nocardioides luteus]|uniref:Uncharacterized protein n=1 Tax=Nocardioides luteus TaxID=1844 RepID=A0A1J4NAB0_9ACTN|nr:hypothetical protein [Nocardioides luteus]OIJ27584.1 hypothetical protein UG56_006100 [Nocardioides luteus]
MPDHLDTFALTVTTGAEPALMPLGTGSADLSALTTAVLSYETTDSGSAATVEWATADGTLHRAVLSHDVESARPQSTEPPAPGAVLRL